MKKNIGVMHYLPKSILHWCYTKLMQIGVFFSHVTETMKTIEDTDALFFYMGYNKGCIEIMAS